MYLGFLLLRVCDQVWNLEPDEEIAPADGIAFGLRHVGDTRRLWRHNE